MNSNNTQLLSIKNNGNPRMITYLGYIMLFTALLFLGKEALAFDIDKGIKAATDPLFTGIQNHWGKIVGLVGVAAALMGEGDLRTRAIRAGMGVGAASGVVLGIMAALT